MEKLFIGLVIVCVFAFSGFNTSPGTGEKIGQLVKVGQEGMFYDTWEGQLIRGGMVDGSGSIGVKPFNFTIENEELVKLAQQYMKNQTEVVVRYRIEGWYGRSRTESEGVFLTGIEPLKK